MVIAFDVFGTVFDLSSIDRQEVRDYARHIRQTEWQPLKLPAHWERLPAHPDSREGIERLRQNHIVVTCSNGPLGLLAKLSKHNGISWDAIIPLELNRVYKPNQRAYMTVCQVLNVQPTDVMMVTANKDFGDLEASAKLGMKPMLIRDGDGDGPKTIIELAESLK
jgi:2-haloalkanoic acid dehalogenase type II